jgi:PAS domain S-box-containing protein
MKWFRFAALIAAAILLNIGLGQLAQYGLDLPIYLDSIGTILVGALLGPLAGAAVGATSNILWGVLLGSQSAVPYAITAAFIGWAAGYAVSRGAFESVWKVGLAGLLTGIGAALISAPITAYLFGDVLNAGADYLRLYLSATGANVLQAATMQGFISDPVDKLISFLVAWGLWRWLRPYFGVITTRGARPFEDLEGYSVAVVVSLLAVLLSFVFLPAFGTSIFSVFYLAVLIAAWRGGMKPALLTTVIGAVSHILLLTSPFHNLGVSLEAWLQMGVFVVVSLAIAAIADQLEKNKQALQAALQSEREARARITAITDGVNEAIALIAPDGRILEVNRRFSEMFGIPAARITGIKLEDARNFYIQVFEDGETLFHLTQAAIHNHEDSDTRIIAQHWPQRRELQLFTTPIRSDGEYLGRLYVFRDVTHEREVDRMKTEFVSLVSHELRTPLTSIKGFTEMVLDGDAGEIDDEVREYLEIVYNNAERLVALVNDLLDISRIESGRIRLKREPVDLRQVVDAVTATMQQKLQEKNQTLTVDIAPDAAEVMGDRDKLVQVLTNYVSNAYKYSPEGASIRIEITRQDDHARVAVIDNGFGISQEAQEQLFTKFYRVDTSLTSAIGGTGLGLSIVKQIIETMGGEVGVQSEEGVGSTFTFTVPLVTPPDHGAAPERGAPEPDSQSGGVTASGSGSILIVEDDPDIARLIAHRLQQAGYETVIATTAAEALDYLDAHHPDLITLDIGLPDMRGDELAARLKADIATRDIPILVISVYAEDPANLQFAAYALRKPIEQDALLETVGKLLKGRAQDPVLIIENDGTIRAQLADALRGLGHDILVADSGAAGLALIAERRPGIILLDLHLPDEDGFVLLKRLKEDRTTADIPIIVLATDPDQSPRTRARVLALGASDLITPPIDMAMLAAEVELFLNAED